MKSPLTAIAIGAILFTIPAAAVAGTAMAPAMAPMAMSAAGATILCRAAAANEKPNATMGGTALVCKSMAKMMKDGKMMVPDTKSDADKTWKSWLEQAIMVPTGYGGTG